MIPYTPSFLVAAATAAAAASAQLPRRPGACLVLERGGGWDSSASFAFVQRVGYWSHYRASAGDSAWPLLHARTMEEMVAAATIHGALDHRPKAGAVAIVGAEPGNGARYAQCGVVIERPRDTPAPDAGPVYANLVWAVADARGGTRLAFARHLFDVSRGDRFINWWHFPEWRAHRRAAA